MRLSKLVAPALTAMGLLLGASALGADQAHLDAFTAGGSYPLPMISLCITASGPAVGQLCIIKANGIMAVGGLPLIPGPNYIMVPNTGAAFYTASAPTIELATAMADPENPGIN